LTTNLYLYFSFSRKLQQMREICSICATIFVRKSYL